MCINSCHCSIVLLLFLLSACREDGTGSSTFTTAGITTAVIVVASFRTELSMSHFGKFLVKIAFAVSRNDALQQIRGGDAWRSAGGKEFSCTDRVGKKTIYGWDGDKTHTLAFHVLVDVVITDTGICFFVMRYVVDLVLLEKRLV